MIELTLVNPRATFLNLWIGVSKNKLIWKTAGHLGDASSIVSIKERHIANSWRGAKARFTQKVLESRPIKNSFYDEEKA